MNRIGGMLLIILASAMGVAYAEDIEIRGCVVDGAGKPIPFASVGVFRHAFGPIAHNRFTGSLTALDEIVGATCEESGEFALTISRELLPVDSPFLTLRATAPNLGYGLANLFMDHPDGELKHGQRGTPIAEYEKYTTPLEMVLDPCFTYNGRVVDEAGNALAGAEVYVSDFQPLAVSDAKGRFTIGNLPLIAKESGRVAVRHPDFPHVWTRSLPGEPIVMQRGAMVSGRVVSASGIGVPGVPIHVEEAFVYSPGTAWLGGTVTDEYGRYSTHAVSGRTLCVMVSDDRIPAQTHYGVPEWRVIKPEKDETLANLDFVMVLGCVLQGRVLDEETGEPVPDVNVSANYRGEQLEDNRGDVGFGYSSGGRATTDIEGRYRIEGLRHALHVLSVNGRGMQLLGTTVNIPA